MIGAAVGLASVVAVALLILALEDRRRGREAVERFDAAMRDQDR